MTRSRPRSLSRQQLPNSLRNWPGTAQSAPVNIFYVVNAQWRRVEALTSQAFSSSISSIIL
ncbi:MAG: hypothetical protein ACYTXC_28580 [Nostoc sp.]